MRELKFRSWNWLGERYDESPCAFLTISGELTPSANRIIEQYTGLKDKNDKEIYEGDIVKGGWLYGKNEHVVKYRDYGFYPFTITDFDGDPMIRNVDIEVIGNIHENPELLERQK